NNITYNSNTTLLGSNKPPGVTPLRAAGQKARAFLMKHRLANKLWLQNNNAPGPRQQNQLGPNTGSNGQSPQRNSSSLNRWLFIIVILLLALWVFQFFNNTSNNNAPQRKELTSSKFYQEINSNNIK